MINRNGEKLQTLPSRLLTPQERVPRYLFRRTSISYGEGLLHTSTLMCDRELLDLEAWDVHLSRHQDWDWVLRVGERRDVAIRMCPDVLVDVAVADARSISMSSDWPGKLNWLERRSAQLTARERGTSFCATLLLSRFGPEADAEDLLPPAAYVPGGPVLRRGWFGVSI